MAKQESNRLGLEKLMKKLSPDAVPEAAPQWPFDPDACGKYEIRIARDGQWFFQNSPIQRKNMCKLFSTVLRRSEDGRYFLVTPAEQGEIEVEDAPFVAVDLQVEGEGKAQNLTFRTNLDHIVPVDADHPIRIAIDPKSGEPSPYVTVRGNLEALVLRSQFYQMVELAEEIEENGEIRLDLWSHGIRFALGTA
jgi:hypothetical protein